MSQLRAGVYYTAYRTGVFVEVASTRIGMLRPCTIGPRYNTASVSGDEKKVVQFSFVCEASHDFIPPTLPLPHLTD